MRLGLVQLFETITGKTEDALPLSIDTESKACNESQGELFDGFNTTEYFSNIDERSECYGHACAYMTERVRNRKAKPFIKETDIAIAAGMHTETGIDFSVLQPEILYFYELSIDAFGAIVYAWMSELPVTGQIIRFGKKILAAQNTVINAIEPTRRGKLEAAQRKAAKLAATDRGDPDVQTVREAAYKVWHETNRLTGLLRFCPDEKGVYTAQCEPDHFVLPALGPHFMERFGETPWAIIDNKRRISICCEMGKPGAPGRTLVFSANAENQFTIKKGQGGEWENLWKHYHKTINNESRNNPDLQKRFMPMRYWKYLSEL